MNLIHSPTIIFYEKYKITYKIIENNCFYLEFIELDKNGGAVNQYSKTFSQTDIDKMDTGVFTNAESFSNTIKRAFNTENCGSFEVKRIKHDKDNSNLIISLKIIVLEINISLPRKSNYQSLDERVSILEIQNLELKQRLLILEKFISTNFSNFSNSSTNNNNNLQNNNLNNSINLNIKSSLLNSSNSNISLSSPQPSTSPFLSLSPPSSP
ncbi:hypothetical protein RB653_001690 [Dictyostelium firmibasis]|uniref:Uncharacterized protein n=1 Tax=Dictyostelium firmibasis TaxID=79012 RepID=A0AAN7U7P8_9MYCE